MKDMFSGEAIQKETEEALAMSMKALAPMKREAYAFQVLCAMFQFGGRLAGGYSAENMAKHCVDYTDALLEALK